MGTEAGMWWDGGAFAHEEAWWGRMVDVPRPRSCQRGGWTATGEGKGAGWAWGGHDDLASMDVEAALDVWEGWTAPNGGCVLRVLWWYGEPVFGRAWGRRGSAPVKDDGAFDLAGL